MAALFGLLVLRCLGSRAELASGTRPGEAPDPLDEEPVTGAVRP